LEYSWLPLEKKILEEAENQVGKNLAGAQRILLDKNLTEKF